MKGILWYVTQKLEGIFDGILMEFRMRILEDKNQIKKSMYIPRFLSFGLYGRSTRYLPIMVCHMDKNPLVEVLCSFASKEFM